METQAEKRGFFTKKTVIVLGIIVLISLVIGLNIYRAREKDVVRAKTAPVVQKKLVEKAMASGKVAASQKEVISSQVTGTVKSVKVSLGQKVKPGQVLMELDIPDAEQRLLQARSALATAQANLAKARANEKSVEVIEAESAFLQAESDYRLVQEKLKRHQLLFEEGAIAKEQWEIVQGEYHTGEAQYHKAKSLMEAARAAADFSLQALEATFAAARASLELVERQTAQQGISSTIAGQVMSIGVENGDLINVNTPLITVGIIDALVVKADISEADAAKIKVGQQALITASAIPEEKYYGKVKEIGVEAVSRVKNQSETTVVPVIVSVEKGTLLRPGYNVDLEITTTIDKQALVIPFEAVVDKQGGPCVYVVQEGVASLRQIRTGISDNLGIQIISGLKQGDQVVLNPPAGLKNGSKVKPL